MFCLAVPDITAGGVTAGDHFLQGGERRMGKGAGELTRKQELFCQEYIVDYNGTLYQSTIDANVWSPANYPAGWEVYVEG